jgi:hypothetical protein
MFLVVTDNVAVAHQETTTDSHLMSSWWLARNAAYLRDAILAATDCAAFCRMAAGFGDKADSQSLK